MSWQRAAMAGTCWDFHLAWQPGGLKQNGWLVDGDWNHGIFPWKMVIFPLKMGIFNSYVGYIIVYNLVDGDWNHGILNDFPETVGNGTSSSQLTNSLHHFSEGVGQPPTRWICCKFTMSTWHLHEESIELLQWVKCLDVFGMSPTEGT